MARDNKAFQLRQWIIEDYKSIIEDPESYGYETLEGHIDEILTDIKDDVEVVFNCKIDKNTISNIVKEYER